MQPNIHFHFCDMAAIDAHFATLEGKLMTLADRVKASADNMIAKADALEAKLAEVRAIVTALKARPSISEEDAATLQSVIDTLDAEAADAEAQTQDPVPLGDVGITVSDGA